MAEVEGISERTADAVWVFTFVSGDVILADLESLADFDDDTEAEIELVIVGVRDNTAVYEVEPVDDEDAKAEFEIEGLDVGDREECEESEARALFEDDRDIEVESDVRPLRDVLPEIDLPLVPD